MITGLLEILEHLEHEPHPDGVTELPALKLARSLENLAPSVLQDILDESALHPQSPTSWQHRLSPEILRLLKKPGEIGFQQIPDEVRLACSLELPPPEIASHLAALLDDPNPVIQAVSLYMLNQLAPQQAQVQAKSLLALTHKPHAIVQEVAQTILSSAETAATKASDLKDFATLEKLVYLCSSDFFGGVHSETLIKLAELATVKGHKATEVITEEGDTCRELLLLMEGEVQIQRHRQNGEIVTESLRPGYVLDELEVLSHAELASTIVAQATPTRILAIPVDTLDDLFDRDHDFARRVLELESRRLQQLMG